MNILLTSAGRRSYLVRYFQEALNGSGLVHAANSDPLTIAMHTADRKVVTPLIYSDDYIPFLLNYCQRHEIRMVVPLFDVDLPVLARARNEFETLGIVVVVSDPDVTEICNDKYKTAEFLENHGIVGPKTFVNYSEALSALESGVVQFPVMTKPRWGMGSIGLYRCDNQMELKVFGEKVRREIFDSYLKYESGVDPEKAVLYQKFVQGKEFGLDVINDLSGNYVCTVVKEKLAMRSGETDAAITRRDEALEALGRKLSAALGHRGNLDVDVLRTGGGEDYILEMNARFGGHYPFSHLAGVDLPKALIAWADQKMHESGCFEFRSDVLGMKELNPVEIGNFLK